MKQLKDAKSGFKRDTMGKKHLVSIVIPTYNRVKDLHRAINSVISQSYQFWELIIIDNYSTDNTDQVVLGFGDKRISLLKIRNNGVIALSRNLGVAMAKGDLVAFLDSDDRWSPNKLELCIAAIDEGNDFIYHDMIIHRGGKKIMKYRKFKNMQVQDPVFLSLLLWGNQIFTSSVLVRKEFCLLAGGFDESPSLVVIEDFDLWLNISRYTNKFKKLDYELGWYWSGKGNTFTAEKALIAITAFLEKYRTEIVEYFGSNLPSWIVYLKAKALFDEKKYIESWKFLKVKKSGKMLPRRLWRFLLLFSMLFIINIYLKCIKYIKVLLSRKIL